MLVNKKLCGSEKIITKIYPKEKIIRKPKRCEEKITFMVTKYYDIIILLI